MITRVAIWTKDKVYVGENRERHDALYCPINKFEGIEHIQGFITDSGEFLTRKQAGEHAFKCGQISSFTDYLLSEDLW